MCRPSNIRLLSNLRRSSHVSSSGVIAERDLCSMQNRSPSQRPFEMLPNSTIKGVLGTLGSMMSLHIKTWEAPEFSSCFFPQASKLKNLCSILSQKTRFLVRIFNFLPRNLLRSWDLAAKMWKKTYYCVNFHSDSWGLGIYMNSEPPEFSPLPVDPLRGRCL